MTYHRDRFIHHDEKRPHICPNNKKGHNYQYVKNTIQGCPVPIGSDKHVGKQWISGVEIWTFDRT